MKMLLSLVCLILFSVSAPAQSRGQGPMPGELAPDFTLNTQDGSQSITLSDLEARPTALVFASYT
jgi:cytochrome oxidase Cu insertion factor (SCO1/SenC/PrrC family)